MAQENSSDVCVVGGGPAGMMAGLLLARAGVEVTVLEKHADFFRDFRGDTVHPATMEILGQLGWLDDFLALPHDRIDRASFIIDGDEFPVADFSHLRSPTPFIAMMPQWDFLDFLREKARQFPGFHLEMDEEATGFIERDGRMATVACANGSRWYARQLVLATDGRDSLVRKQKLLPLTDLNVPIDVLWFKVPKRQGGGMLRGQITQGRMIVLIDRGTYWQCAFVIPKGYADALREDGIAKFRALVRETAPEIGALEEAIPDWNAIKLLSVSLDRLTRWHRRGLLAIGDAAHAMSPVGGVGINLAIQDAVAMANILAGPLARGESVDPLLRQVQTRRQLPVKIVQAAQKFAHERLLEPVVSGANVDPPLPFRLTRRLAPLRRLPARLIGYGFRREKLTAPAA